MRARLLTLLLFVLPVQAASPVVDDAPEWRYTLRPGDTLIGVSARYLVRPQDWPRLQRLNRIADPHRLVPGSALRIPLAWLRHEPAPAQVVAVAGDARVTLPGAAERPLASGETLGAGAALVAGANSSVTLRLADGSLLVLQPGARLALDTLSVYAGGGMVDSRLRLQHGRVEVGANPARAPGSRLQVITPSAVAAVRGTRFRVAAEGDTTREETLDGTVGLAAAGREVQVGAGQGSLAAAGQPPLPPVALLDAPDVAGLPRRVEMLPMRFTLPAQRGAVTWLGQIAPDAGFERILLEQTAAAPQLMFGDLPDGHYTLRVRAADDKGLHGWDALHAFELDARPFPPLVVGPGTRVRTPRPVLQWSPVIGAQAYRVELARDVAFAERLLASRTSDGRQQPDTDLAPGTYHWRVASIDADGQGPFAPPQRFIYDPLPGAPDLAQSAPLFADGGLALALPPPPAGLHYELVLSTDAERRQVAWQGTSADGQLRVARIAAADHYLAARLVEADGTAGPWATRVIEAPPPPRWPALLFLLPLLL